MSKVVVRYSHGDHTGGTKSYRIMAITNRESGEGLFLCAWGKKGYVNRTKVTFHRKGNRSNAGSAAKMFDRKLRDRVDNDYAMALPASCADAKGFRDLMTRFEIDHSIFMRIPPTDLKKVWPDCEIPDELKATFSMFDPEVEEEIKGQFDKASADALAAEKQAELDALKSNPIFGMF